jgi:hypothetical protein
LGKTPVELSSRKITENFPYYKKDFTGNCVKKVYIAPRLESAGALAEQKE